MSRKFTVIVEKGEDGYLLSEVVELPGCHTQGKTMDELLSRTKEAIELYLETMEPEESSPKFIGIHEIDIEA